MVNETAYDEIFVEAFWCSKKNTTIPAQKKQRAWNELDKILRNDILTTIDKFPRILELFFNTSYTTKDRMNAEEKVCPGKEGDEEADNFKKYEENLIHQLSYGGYRGNGVLKKLVMQEDQLETLFIYPNVIQELLKIIVLPERVRNMDELFKSAPENPIVLKQVLFKKVQSYQYMDSNMRTAFFGGAFRGSNLNPFAGRSGCPPNFIKVTILVDLNICVSKDSTLSWPIRFGGFHHCASKIKMCPRGYSEYLGTIEDGCEYFYCIRFGTRHEFPPPIVNKPPYISYEKALSQTTKTES